MGVKQKTWSENSSSLVCSRNSLGIVAFREDVDEAPQPAIGIGLGGRQANALPGLERGADVLVEAMRRNAALGDLMHGKGADLQLDAHVMRPDHGGVDRAVVVLLGFEM